MTDAFQCDGLDFLFGNNHFKTLSVIDFGEIRIKLKHIDSNPGHVQSGLYIWPASENLARHLIHRWTMLSRDSVVVVELGAGCGLAGITSTKLPNCVCSILTDYDPGSMNILEENIVENRVLGDPYSVTENLEWGAPLSSSLITHVSYYGKTSLVIGADLLYCTSVVKPLFTTVNDILNLKPGIFILASSFDVGQV